MCVATSGTARFTLYPTILSLYLNIYFLACLFIPNQAVGLYAMTDYFSIRHIYLRKLVIIEPHINIYLVKLTRLPYDFKFRTLKQILKHIIKRVFSAGGIISAISLPFASQSVGKASHSCIIDKDSPLATRSIVLRVGDFSPHSNAPI